jgi:hypothetical protein
MTDYSHAAFLLIKQDWLAELNRELDEDEEED